LGGLAALALIFIILLIIMNLRKKEESQIAILMKIMTNYLQVIAAVLSFNIDYPDEINDIFLPVDKAGSASTPFVSFDCFVQDRELTLFTPSPSFLRVFLSGILPILFFASTLIIWTILFYTKHSLFKNWRRNVIVSNVVILFLLHPNLTRTFLTMFQ